MGNRYWVGNTDSWNGTAASKWALTSGGAGGQAEPTSADDVFFDANSGANTVTIATTTAICKSVTCTGFTGTLTGSAAMDAYGSILLVSGMTFSWTGLLTVKLTAGTSTITSAGKTFSALTLNGAGGTLTFADAFVTTGTCTFLAGTFNDGNQNLSMSTWSSTGTGVRVYVFGTANTWTITSSGTCFESTPTNVTGNAQTQVHPNSCTLDFTYSGASARTIKRSAIVMPKTKISAGSGTVTFNADVSDATFGYTCMGIDFTGYTGTANFLGTTAQYALRVYDGSIKLAPAPASFTCSGGGGLFLGGYFQVHSGTLNLAGATWPTNIHIFCGAMAAAGTTVTLVSNLTALGSVYLAESGVSGSVFDAAGFNVTCATVSSSSALTRTITMGSGTWTLTSTGAVTVWNMATTTGLTLNANTAIIDLTGNTTSVRTITANSVLLPSIRISGGTGAGSVTLTNVNCAGLIFANTYACTGFANQTVTIRGNLQLSNHASFALTAGANAWTWTHTSGIATITSQGKAMDFPLTLNGIGGTLQLADTLNLGATRTLTLTRGTFDSNGQTNNTATVLMNGTAGTTTLTSGATVWACNLTVTGAGGTLSFGDNFTTGATKTVSLTSGTLNDNNKNLSMGLFSSTGASTRSIGYGTSNTWSITGSGTVWNTPGAAGFTKTGSGTTMNFTYAGAAARTISQVYVGGGGEYLLNCHITAGNGTLLFDKGTSVFCALIGGVLDFTGYSGACTFNGTGANDGNGGAHGWILSPTATYANSGGGDFLMRGNIAGNGVTFPGPINMIGTVNFTTAFITSGTINFGATFSAGGTLTTNNFNITCSTFTSSNTFTRTLTMGSGTLSLTGTGTVWDTSTSTNLTITGTGTIALTANSATARTITGGSALLPSLSMATGSYAPTFTSCNFLNITVTSGYTGTIANQALTWRGNLSLAATGAVFSAGSNAWTWANTSGTVTSTINGRTLDFPITVNGSATHQLADALTLGSAKALTHTAGTLDLASYVATAGSYVSANSNTRVLATGTGTLALAGTGVVYDTSTSTNWSYTGTGTIKLTDSSATARSLSAGSMSLPNVWVSAGTSTTTATNVTGVLDLNFTGMGAGTWSCGAGTFTIGGSLTLVSAMTYSCAANVTFNATSTGKTITSWAKSLSSGTVTFNGSGGEWTLQDAPATFTSANALTVSQGHLNTNGFAVTTPTFTFTGSSTRTLSLGASTMTITGTGTIFDASGTNQTINASTSIVDCTDGTSTLKTFNTGGTTLNVVRVKQSDTNRFQFAGGGTLGVALAA